MKGRPERTLADLPDIELRIAAEAIRQHRSAAAIYRPGLVPDDLSVVMVHDCLTLDLDGERPHDPMLRELWKRLRLHRAAIGTKGGALRIILGALGDFPAVV